MAIKAGKISSVNPSLMRARVTLEDREGIISDELAINCFGSGDVKHYWIPTVGEEVWIAENDNGGGEGMIIGSRYSEVNPPKENNANIRKIDFGEGSFIEFDRSTGNLTINCTGNITIKGARIDLNP